VSRAREAADEEFTNVDQVGDYVVEQHLAEPGAFEVEHLSGGVSSHVYRVRIGGDCFVLKQARQRLDVSREWLSDPRRSGIEAAFAEVAMHIVPGAVPRPRFVDPAQHVFGMDCAADGSVTWKSELLAGEVDESIARQAGRLIGRIHAATRDSSLAEQFGDLSIFDELRVDPYLRSLLTDDAVVRARVDAIARRLLEPGTCLVHGDFSPKNLLVTPHRDLLLIDHEVAHFGDPSFDVAFFLNHLCLKAFHMPGLAPELLAAAAAFLGTYAAEQGGLESDLDQRIARVLAALMLARIDGKSPVEYLDEPNRVRVRAFAVRQIRGEPTTVAAILAAVGAAA
jgi:aminoglycoside phosphotransferase (APT) family kinase protein